MVPEVEGPEEPRGLAVLLHPHPHFGGNRFHPLIDGLYRRLPGLAVSAVRFDFSSADLAIARDEVGAAIDAGLARWSPMPVVVVGYSFGAAVAATVDDERVAGWFLVAPPAAMLADAVIGDDPRPKAIVVPEHDQFSAPAIIRERVAGWAATAVSTAPNADHFLGGALDTIVATALEWIDHTVP